jgi:hypothetical protein
MIRVGKSLADWRMFQLTSMCTDCCDAPYKVIGDVNAGKRVHDTAHLDFGRGYADGYHDMPPKRLDGMEILA